MTPFITQYLAEAKAREDAATEGPWKANASGRVSSENGPLFIADITKMIIGADPPNGNLEFIANARTTQPRLRRALEKAIEQRNAEVFARVAAQDSDASFDPQETRNEIDIQIKEHDAEIESILKGEA